MPSIVVSRSATRITVGVVAALGFTAVLIPAVGRGQPPGDAHARSVGPELVSVPVRGEQGKENAADADNRPRLTLGQCIAIAFERQPSLKAVQASQNSSSAGQTALHNIGRVGQTLSRDLPVRKEQAARGQIATAADIQKVRNEIVYDATRLYYTVIYARQQQQIADDVVFKLVELIRLAEIQIEQKMPGDITRAKIDTMKIGLAKAKTLQLQARTGEQRAYAGLREVMAVDRSFVFRVADDELPLMAQKAPLTVDEVIAMALARRPEMALAAAGVDAFRLEVYAQARIPFRRTVPTFASGSDIHGRPIPQGSRDENYRPEAIAPEMPVQLVGSKYDRVCKAMAHSQRADAVYEKARNLIALEAENGFLTFEQSADRVAIAKDEFLVSMNLKDRVLEQFAEARSPKDQLMQGYVLASQGEADFVDAMYQYILTLAALERITAGGVKPDFPGR